MYAEEETGNRINDSIYNARISVEDRLNVQFEYVRNQQTYADRAQLGQAVRTSNMANDGAYDVVFGWPIIELILEDKNSLQNLADNPYINFEKEYWTQTLFELMPNSDEIYLASGDGSISMTKHMYCMFFNKDQMNDYGITDNLYDIVRAGDWTLELLKEYCKVGYNDVNGNAEADFGDEFALTFGDYNKFINLPFSSGLDSVVRSDKGYELGFGSERTNEVYDDWYDLIYNTKGVLIPGWNNSNNTLAVNTFGESYSDKTFMEGRAMFTMSLVGDAGAMFSDTKFEYGLIPYPKHDASQENYATSTQSNTYFCLPSYADPELSGAVIEAWTSECHKTVHPEYFEVTLKARYAADSDMAEMYDLLRQSFVLSVGDFFMEPMNYISCEFQSMLASKKEGQWMSNFTGKENKCNETLSELWTTLS